MITKEQKLRHIRDAASHLGQAAKHLAQAYTSAMATHERGIEFPDEIYALGTLQSHMSTVDTLLYRRIEALKGAPRREACGCCDEGCVCWNHRPESTNPPENRIRCDYHKDWKPG